MKLTKKRMYMVTTSYEVTECVVVEAKSKKEANDIVAKDGFNCNECVDTMGGNFHSMLTCDRDATEVVECGEGYEEVA